MGKNMIGITGATGQLGRLVIDRLVERGLGSRIVALVRDPAKAADLAALGVAVRAADYDAPEGLVPALAGVDRLLLISGNAVGQRVAQHRAVIDAARDAGVGFVAYTSVLHADTSPIGLAEEHRQTEAALRASGLAFALLRNGWYMENYLGGIAPALQFGVMMGSSGAGRIAAATRADLAAAAATVLAGGSEHDGHTYELAGDFAFTMADFAAEIARQSGKPVVYRDMAEADYAKALEGAGLPPPIAAMIAQSSASAASEALFDDSRTISRLTGRPTTGYSVALAATLAA